MILNPDGSVVGTPEGIRVFPLTEYIVSDKSGWIPGTFETVEDAVDYVLGTN